jgi:fimbrial chaperone protein
MRKKDLDSFTAAIAVAWVVALGATGSSAGSLQVAPVLLEIPSPATNSHIVLHNFGEDPIEAQIRVLQWTQKNGHDELVPSDKVVASPPAASLKPGEDYVVRVIRLSDVPVEGEEEYRLLVDELPQPVKGSTSYVRLLFRYSIPVFFLKTDTDAQLNWEARQAGGRLVVSVANAGGRYSRISGLHVQCPSGGDISFGSGLQGYVLPHSNASWSAPLPAGSCARTGAVLKLTGQGSYGPINAAVVLAAEGH